MLSWNSLQDDTALLPEVVLPRLLTDNPFAFYYLLCFPHRLNKNSITLLKMEQKIAFAQPTF
jgi:hypothetical protein